MSKELIEDLRAVSETGCDPDLPFRAADLIEQQQKRIEELERTHSSYKNLTEAQEKQMSVLRQRLYELRGADKTLDSERAANEELTEQLAASQAREAKLREVLEEIGTTVMTGKKDHAPGKCNSAGKLVLAALSQPKDDTALREMITKAGEVMRERCAKELNRLDYWYSARAIRALPVVTLDDLKVEAK